jgi:hypothetical protein
MGWVCDMYGKNGNTWRILIENPKEPFGRPRHRWEDSTKIDLKELGWGSKDWIHLGSGYRQLAGSYKHNNKLMGSVKFGNLLD